MAKICSNCYLEDSSFAIEGLAKDACTALFGISSSVVLFSVSQNGRFEVGMVDYYFEDATLYAHQPYSVIIRIFVGQNLVRAIFIPTNFQWTGEFTDLLSSAFGGTFVLIGEEAPQSGDLRRFVRSEEQVILFALISLVCHCLYLSMDPASGPRALAHSS